MWEEGVRIYDTSGVFNNFSYKLYPTRIICRRKSTITIILSTIKKLQIKGGEEK